MFQKHCGTIRLEVDVDVKEIKGTRACKEACNSNGIIDPSKKGVERQFHATRRKLPSRCLSVNIYFSAFFD